MPGADEPVTAWVLMQYAHVVAAARDHATFSSRDPLQEQSSAPTLMLVNHDNPEHDRLRDVVNVAFLRRRVLDLEPWVRAVAAELVAEAGDGEVETVAALTSMLPARVMLQYLGLPPADAARFRAWATAFMLSADLTPEERQRSNAALMRYFIDVVQRVHADTANGVAVPESLVTALLAAEHAGERLSLDEVTRFCVTLVVAGSETTTFLLTNLLHHLATLPEVTARLRRDRSLVRPFIEESLRHSGPPQRLFRIATRDVDIDGRRIRAGDWVALFFGAANHDPAVFPAPEVFDPGRPNLAQHLTFGSGIHHCLGSALARLEATALVEAVLDRHPRIALGATAPVPQRTSLLTHGWDRLSLEFAPAR